MVDTEMGPGRQAFLFGPSLYLRPVEPEDADTAAIWHHSPFPAPAEIIRDRLKRDLQTDPDDTEAEITLLICHRQDDRIRGSVRMRMQGERFGRLEPYIDPLLPGPCRAETVAELACILMPWMLDECHLMTVVMRVAGEHDVVTGTIEQLGGRIAYRLREYFLIDGQRVDAVVYQCFNSGWVEQLGPPRDPELAGCTVHGQTPVRACCELASADRPPEALSVGERVYLRAFRPEEGALVSAWSLQETQVYRPSGRPVFGGFSYGEFHNRLARHDPPSWVRFAIVSRETDELVGCCGLDMISWVHGHATSEVVYFRQEHRGAGYAADSGMLMLEYGFGVLGLHSIHAYVSEINTRSIKAISKRGYTDCGYLAWRSLRSGGLSGNYVFDMLDREWQSSRQEQCSHGGA